MPEKGAGRSEGGHEEFMCGRGEGGGESRTRPEGARRRAGTGRRGHGRAGSLWQTHPGRRLAANMHGRAAGGLRASGAGSDTLVAN